MLASGIKLRHLPTTGGGPMMNAILGGHAQAVMTPVSLAAAHVKAGKLRLLAHTRDGAGGRVPGGARRSSRRATTSSTRRGRAWWRPKITPPQVIKILRDATRQAVKEPEVVDLARQARDAHRLHGRRRVQRVVGARTRRGSPRW